MYTPVAEPAPIHAYASVASSSVVYLLDAALALESDASAVAACTDVLTPVTVSVHVTASASSVPW